MAIVAGIATMDLTFTIIAAPVGLYALLTKSPVFVDESLLEDEEENGES